MMAALGPKNSKAIEEQAWHKVSVHYGARKTPEIVYSDHHSVIASWPRPVGSADGIFQ